MEIYISPHTVSIYDLSTLSLMGLTEKYRFAHCFYHARPIGRRHVDHWIEIQMTLMIETVTNLRLLSHSVIVDDYMIGAQVFRNTRAMRIQVQKKKCRFTFGLGFTSPNHEAVARLPSAEIGATTRNGQIAKESKKRWQESNSQSSYHFMHRQFNSPSARNMF